MGTICYILGTFPSRTEHFILDEIMGLRAKGVDVLVVSLSNPGPSVEVAEAKSLRKEVIYLPKWDKFSSWLSLIRGGARFPFRGIKTILKTCFRAPIPLRSYFAGYKHLLAAWMLADLLKPHAVQHIHAHFAGLPAHIAHLLSEMLKLSYSISAHAHDIFAPNPLLNDNVQGAKFVVTCTDFNRQVLADLPGSGDATQVFRVYHGVNLARWPFRLRTSIVGVVSLLTVARLVEKKGLQDVVEALTLLRAEGIPFNWILIGEGPDKQQLEQAIKEKGLSQHVKLLGALPREEIRSHYLESDIFVLPAVVAKNGDRDGLPNVIPEAMASGLPVISCPVSAIPEMVEEGETGLLVPEHSPESLKDAIVRLIEHPELYAHLSRSGREKVENSLRFESGVVQIKDLFERFVGV